MGIPISQNGSRFIGVFLSEAVNFKPAAHANILMCPDSSRRELVLRELDRGSAHLAPARSRQWPIGGSTSGADQCPPQAIAARTPTAAPPEDSPWPWLLLGGENVLVAIGLAARLRRRIGAV